MEGHRGPSKLVALLLGSYGLAWLSAAVLQRLEIIALPAFMDPDVGGYLTPAASALHGDGFVHVLARTFPYPLFLTGMLAFFQTFTAISAAQHLMGVVGGVLFAVGYGRLFAALATKPWIVALQTAAGITAAGLHLTSSETVRFEHSIRPEGIFAFLWAVSFFGFCELLRTLVRRRDSKTILLPTFLFLYFALFAFLVKGQWILSAAFSVGLAVLILLISTASVGRRFVAGALPLAAFILTGWLPEQILIRRTDPTAPAFNPMVSFFVHGRIMAAILERDIQDPTFARYERNMLMKLKAGMERELDRGKREPGENYPTLGYNPDLMIWATNPAVRVIQQGLPEERHYDFYTYYVRRMLREERGAYLRKVRNELKHIYSKRTLLPLQYPIQVREALERSVSHIGGSLLAFAQAKPVYEEAGRRAPKQSALWYPWLTIPLHLSNLFYNRIARLFVLLALASCMPAVRRSTGLQPIHFLPGGVLMGMVFLGLLAAALSHSLSVYRYVSLLSLVTLGGFASMVACIVVSGTLIFRAGWGRLMARQ